jgi:hypothetical protein
MGEVMNAGVKDTQILFLGIGDHECDESPLQVGQFESSDELLDKWLKDVFLEGGGGANSGESYLLAWYFAAYHTSIDCLEKRDQKGFLFTIGDEPTLSKLPKYDLNKIMGAGQYDDFDSSFLLNKAREKYLTYHIHVKETNSGSRQEVIDNWKQLMQDDCIVVNKYQEIPEVIAQKMVENLGEKLKKENTLIQQEEKKEEEML